MENPPICDDQALIENDENHVRDYIVFDGADAAATSRSLMELMAENSILRRNNDIM